MDTPTGHVRDETGSGPQGSERFFLVSKWVKRLGFERALEALEELCLFGCTCLRRSTYGWEKMPRDTQRHELLLLGDALSDPALNLGCGWLWCAGTREPADAFPCLLRSQSQLCLCKRVLEMSQPVPTGTLTPPPLTRRWSCSSQLSNALYGMAGAV